MIHQVYACRTNLGDWLSARGIRRLLAEQETTEHLCNDPFVEATLARLALATPRDLIVIGGGGLLMDYFAPFWEGFLPISKRVPYCIWGAGYCDLKREDTHPPRELIREIAAGSRLCVVRDELTRDYLALPELLPAVACPSFAALEWLPPVTDRIVHSVNYDNVGEGVYEAMRDATQEFARRSGRRYAETNNELPQGSEPELEAALGLYAASDLVVSSRLHGCIIGLAMGRKVLAVSGDRKVESFMSAAELDAWVLDLADVDGIGARIEDLRDQPDRRSFAEEARVANRAVAGQVVKIAAAVTA